MAGIDAAIDFCPRPLFRARGPPRDRRDGRARTSRFSRMEIPRMHRFSDRAGSAGGLR